ncbi:MAG TPA: ABC transporter ATP-binding protein [Gammaproteobacteria bacterium]|nr:ABC transporter ATP-binding protein [Gammaproteobacteria bacterium]
MTPPDLQHSPKIRMRDIHFSRGDRVIFDGINIDIYPGKVTAIMGPSGTGKTTLLHLMTGLLKPSRGQIEINGEAITSLSEAGLKRVRRHMGMLFQGGALFTDMNVFDNVAFALREHTDLPASMVNDLVLMKLEAVGLRGAQHLMPRELSGGMARRVALARSIALDPEIILYDEPFAGQDPITMGMLVKLIRLLNDTLGLTSVIVSHDIMETVGIADYIYLLSEGKVVAEGTSEQMRHSSSAHADQFMHGKADGPVAFHYPAPDYYQELMHSEGET